MAGKKPDYQASTVTVYGQDDNGKDLNRWTNIGVAFKGDNSIQVLLDAVLVNGKIVLTVPKVKE